MNGSNQKRSSAGCEFDLFPGGGFDDEDADLKRTALREAFEEIGLKENEVEILGTRDKLEFVKKMFEDFKKIPAEIRIDTSKIGPNEVCKQFQRG